MMGLNILAGFLPAMSESERRRYLDGRDDWQENAWQDHCGVIDCEHCTGYIKYDERKAAIRRQVLS